MRCTVHAAMEEPLRINKSFAAKYAKKKEAEELSKLRDKYGGAALSVESESSDSEEEDDGAEGVTPQVEKDFLRTLSLLKSRDPRIYDQSCLFYESQGTGGEEEGGRGKGTEGDVEKPMFLRDHERKRLLEKGSAAELSDSEEDEDMERASQLPTYHEEQRSLRDSFMQAVVEADTGQSDASAGSVLRVRRRTAAEAAEEEQRQTAWLHGGGGAGLSRQEAKDMDTLRNYWSRPNLDPSEMFLRDYILDRRYVDQDAAEPPDYTELASASSGEEGEVEGGHSQGAESEDEAAVERMEEFERQFNFRFEEPGSSLVSSYPRTVAGSVRLEDHARSRRRKEREERKEKEKSQRQLELRRLKNLKRREIAAKLDKLKEITGNPVVGFSEEDFEADFDPGHYDALMQRVFDEQYYAEEGVGPEEKPAFPDSDEEAEVDWDQWQPGPGEGPGEEEEEEPGEGEPHCEEAGFNMDADYEGGGEDVEEGRGEAQRFKRRRKRSSKLHMALKRKKPTFDPAEKSFQEYMDEYYRLDYEDLIGDLPCRFKYRQTIPNDYGLTTEEILCCEDKELNRWVSVKKAVQIRTEEEEARDRRKYRRKAKRLDKKLQILRSLAKDETEGKGQQVRGRGRGREGGTARSKQGPWSRRRHPLACGAGLASKLSATRLGAYGLRPMSRRKPRRAET